MPNKLQEHFPMIRDREEVLYEIRNSPALSATFFNWEEQYQNDFLDFCTGVRGVKLLYDSFSKNSSIPTQFRNVSNVFFL